MKSPYTTTEGTALRYKDQTINPHPHQSPLNLTLDAPGLLILCSTLLLAVHLLSRAVITSFIIAFPVVICLQNDYSNFISLGPGGTPSTFWGYLRISYLRIFALRDPFVPPKLLAQHRTSSTTARASNPPRAGILLEYKLPYRPGPRPQVAGIAPQRQLDQPGSLPCYHSLRQSLERLAEAQQDKFAVAVSCFEKNGLALFARRPVQNTCGGEVCHIHDSDRSLHLTLTPEDIAEVLQKGWGQRHPLARDRAWPPMPVPRGFVMVYAPRDMEEMGIVLKIIEAAAWYCTQEKVDIKVQAGPKERSEKLTEKSTLGEVSG